jgi:cellulose synthase/poly-beta-1,6-N-acetylglucosamine synthase-like glycosyltransferase
MGKINNKDQYNIDNNNTNLDHLSDSVCLDYGKISNSTKPIKNISIGSDTPPISHLSASTLLSKSQKIFFTYIIGIILISFILFDFYNLFMTFFYLIIIFKFIPITIYSIKKYNEK